MEDMVTIDEEEMMLIDLYKAKFKETPFVAFLHPDLSKKLLKRALKANKPYKFEEIPNKVKLQNH